MAKNSHSTQLMEIYTRLRREYGDPQWWPANSPYEVIVGAILVQNTNWGNVEKAFANFGDRLAPEFVMGLERIELAEIIRPAGFFNQKSEYLQNVTRWFSKYEYSVEKVRAVPMNGIRKELLSIKGIGRETADAILLYAFEFPSFVVDAYTIRLLERLPLPIKRDYDSIKMYFEKHLEHDVKLFNEYHALIVLHAKAHCRKAPACENCPLSDMCKTAKS